MWGDYFVTEPSHQQMMIWVKKLYMFISVEQKYRKAFITKIMMEQQASNSIFSKLFAIIHNMNKLS